MASEQRDNPAGKPRPAGRAVPALPAVEIIATASERATRKLTAVQRTPIGRRIYEVVRNLMWVVPLTMLVWLYAEREQIEPPQRILVPITIRADRADRIVSLANAADKELSIEVRGTKVRIQQAQEELARQQGLPIVVPSQLGLGTDVPMPTLEAINANPVFADRGIAVTSCTPSTLSLQVDERVSVQVHPEVPADIAARLEGPAALDPPTVTLTGPKRLLTGSNPAEVVAEITPQMLPKISGEIPAVPLRLKVPNEQVTISPAIIKAQVALKASAVKYVINSMPVFVYGSPALFSTYRVNFPTGPFLAHVTVQGPQEEINKIANGDFMPKALLEVAQQDVRAQLPRSPDRWVLPPNVTVSDEDKNRTITFELVERTRTEQ